MVLPALARGSSKTACLFDRPLIQMAPLHLELLDVQIH